MTDEFSWLLPLLQECDRLHRRVQTLERHIDTQDQQRKRLEIECANLRKETHV